MKNLPYFRFLLIISLSLNSYQIVFAADKCHFLKPEGPGPDSTKKYRAFKCKYTIAKRRDRLFKWAEEFCYNRGYQRAVMNSRYSGPAKGVARGSLKSVRRFRIINGLCVSKGHFAREDRTKHCVRINLKVTCKFALRKKRSELKAWANGMCHTSKLKPRQDTVQYSHCSRNGKRCKWVYMMCKH